jgi:pimeloyl-ACP methyl ester carboxylesterase
MDKLAPPPRSPRPAPPLRRDRFTGGFFATLLVAAWVLALRGGFFDRQPTAVLNTYNNHTNDTDNSVYTDWTKIVPSTELEWTPCFRTAGNFSCTRLTVAMDPARPLSASADNPKVHIALVLLPAPGHGGRRWSESPLLLNPGGPGGSGAGFVLGAGPALQQAVAPQRDLIGFDPRGIGATWPRADCFDDDRDATEPADPEAKRLALLHRVTWMMLTQEVGLPGEHPGALGLVTRHAQAASRLCLEKDGKDSLFRHAGTPFVAGDMKSIVEAWDRWRDGLMKDLDEPVEVNAPSVPSTKGKLVYWGFSYGTFLGATFASMYREFAWVFRHRCPGI